MVHELLDRYVHCAGGPPVLARRQHPADSSRGGSRGDTPAHSIVQRFIWPHYDLFDAPYHRSSLHVFAGPIRKLASARPAFGPESLRSHGALLLRISAHLPLGGVVSLDGPSRGVAALLPACDDDPRPERS